MARRSFNRGMTPRRLPSREDGTAVAAVPAKQLSAARPEAAPAAAEAGWREWWIVDRQSLMSLRTVSWPLPGHMRRMGLWSRLSSTTMPLPGMMKAVGRLAGRGPVSFDAPVHRTPSPEMMSRNHCSKNRRPRLRCTYRLRNSHRARFVQVGQPTGAGARKSDGCWRAGVTACGLKALRSGRNAAIKTARIPSFHQRQRSSQ